MSTEAIERLEVGRKELLDLGLRNPLINFRDRTKQVKVVDETSSEIYRLLVIEGRKLSFESLPENKAKEVYEQESGQAEKFNSEDWESVFAQPEDDFENGPVADRHIDNKLQTSLRSEKLQKNLVSIYNDSKTYLEEQGVNILYIALGFLHWFEAPSAKEPRRAPLILIPVELSRASAKKRFKVSYTGEDIGDNLSLIEKMHSEFNIDFPKIEEAEDLDLDNYFNSVSKAIRGDERWEVQKNEMTLGFFSFGKFLMYKDLDPEHWKANINGEGFSVLEGLLTNGLSEPECEFHDDIYIDEIVTPKKLHQVKDADSSQILAILDSISGRNFVLQGPPGTGKSQTITNMIAECLGQGRTVLFVSEKMAALDVVKRRLDEVGLGDAVLELHSHKSKKKEVLSEIKRTLHQGRPIVDDFKDDIDALTQFRDELNAYCKAVNTPIGKTNTSFVSALGNALKHSIDFSEIPVFDFQYMSQWDESDYRSARMRVETLDRHLSETGSLGKNPFNLSSLKEFLPSQRQWLEKLLDEGLLVTNDLLARAAELSEAMGLETPQKRSDVGILCRAARRAMDAPHLEGLTLNSGKWQERRDDIAKLIEAGKEICKAHDSYDDWLIDEAWQQDLVEIRQHYVTKGIKWWRFLSGDYRRSKARMQGLCRKPLHSDVHETIKMIDTVLDSQKHQKQFDELSELGISLFGAQWKNEQSDWQVLEKLSQWVVALYRDLGDGIVPEGIINFLSGSPKLDRLRQKVQTVEDVYQIADALKLNLPNDTNGEWDLSLEGQIDHLTLWRDNLYRLFDLIRYNQLTSEMANFGLDFVVSISGNWDYGEGSLLRLFDFSWYNGLVEKAYLEFPEIKMFDRTHHEHILKEFNKLDRMIFRYNQIRLAAKHWESIPKLGNGGELMIINREINKKRRLMPIRKLIGQAGRAIQAIKPIFMMSPMSIATYIPQGSVQFDLVVFDEASQVKPVDAFGAIIRGRQTIVVGDSKQLPPTSFFDSLTDSADEDDYENVGDMESILSLFLGKGAPERMLRWHYRSRHDSLIAVSNNEFYNNRLVVFPSPGLNTAARGLRFHHLPDTAYDRGRTRSNAEEAKIVANEVMKHAKRYPDLTLGVVAFSTAQRDAISMQLELLRRQDLSCEPFFNEGRHEPFFVKNLENVQGDERDVIFISIGYGKTAEGYMTMSFGPLNRDGGERRLNVLISRAKLAMDVFSNFTSDDIDLNRTQARGAVALKNFLHYAESGNLETPFKTGKQPDSPFEEEVIKAIAQSGYNVEPQVGTAGFFIDIAIKDRKNPGRYIIGIECDGATYHSSQSARDRDRLRQEVLEGLGWRLHRIWSTDWYRNPQKELERTLEAINRAEDDYQNNSKTQEQDVSAKKEAETETVIIERDDNNHGAEETEIDCVQYEKKVPQVLLISEELYQLSTEELFSYVFQVVQIESPIHKTELTKRIIEGAGLKRSGRRIQNAVKAAVRYGVREEKIIQKGDFIWDAEMNNPIVRDRSNLPAASKKIEFVSPEEMQLAIRIEVEKGFTIKEEDAISSAARSMGFLRVTSHAKKIFQSNIKQLLRDKQILINDDLISPYSQKYVVSAESTK